LPFADRGLLLLTLHFAMLLGNTRKSGGPPPLEPSFKVKGDVHSQRSGFVVTPGVEGLNARGPLKVHPKWRHEESALATLRWRPNPAPKIRTHQRPSWGRAGPIGSDCEPINLGH